MNKKIRVLVVDDSAFNRQSIAAMLQSSPNIEVVDAVADGREAIKSVSIHKPNVITLDLEMPNMDGFTFLRWLMANNPIPVIVISSQSDTKNVFTALDLGAVDFLAKPSKRISNEINNIKDDLLKKVEIIAELPIEKIMARVKISPERMPEKDSAVYASVDKAAQKVIASSNIDLVAIGSSTGGPPALQSIISVLPEGFPSAVAISQHMPSGFTRYFAERMDKNSKVEVKEAEEGDSVNKGRVLISPGGYHMTFKRKGDSIKVNLKKRSVSDLYTPSVDVMMASASEVFGNRVLGVILTGMGNDGKIGMREIKNKNGQTIAESEETAVVFGMPGEAIKDGSIDIILPLPKIAGEIIRRCTS